jgi:outer membrane protein OmpA-like peptidoglycan-associated protein
MTRQQDGDAREQPEVHELLRRLQRLDQPIVMPPQPYFQARVHARIAQRQAPMVEWGRRLGHLSWAPLLALGLLLGLTLAVWWAGSPPELTRLQHTLTAMQAQIDEMAAERRQWQTQQAETARQITALHAAITPPEDAVAATVILPLTFAPASATIQSQYYADLEKLGHALTSSQLGTSHVQIIGHTDSLEAPGAEVALSLQRAAAVQRYVLQHFPIAPTRLLIQGAGARQPFTTNATPEGRRHNRRIEVVTVALRPS